MNNFQEAFTIFLYCYIERRQSYHDHKEKMAWAGSTIYFTFCLILISWLILNADNLPNDIKSCFSKSICIFLLMIIFIFTFKFIHMQFKMRWIASDEVVIFTRYLFKIMSGEKNII